jgi:hypothetical protein
MSFGKESLEDHLNFMIEQIALAKASLSGRCHVWMYMDPARLQPILAGSGSRSQLLTYIRLRYAA